MIIILDDQEFVDALIQYNSFDKGIFLYIESLKYLGSKGEKLNTIFESETFINLFTTNRRLLYNNGGFKELRKIKNPPLNNFKSSKLIVINVSVYLDKIHSTGKNNNQFFKDAPL